MKLLLSQLLYMQVLSASMPIAWDEAYYISHM